MLGELARARVLLEPRALRGELPKAFPVRVAKDGDDESVVERDRKTNVRCVARHKLSILDPRAKPRMVAKCRRRSRDDGVGVRRAGGLAPLTGQGHVDIARDGELRLLTDALGHALSDRPPHARERFPLLI